MTMSLRSGTNEGAIQVNGVDAVQFTTKGLVSSNGNKNKLRNGDFSINQRAVSGTVTLAANAYGHDGWKAGASGCTYTFATVINVTTITISAGSLIQVIEGIYLQSGTHTLSWGGTAQGKIGAGAYSASGVTGTAVGGTNLNIEFGTGTLRFVQFEWGTVATYFEFRLNELQICLGHYEVWGRYTYQYTGNAGSGHNFPVRFAGIKRVIPSLGLIFGSSVNTAVPSFVNVSTAGFTYASTADSQALTSVMRQFIVEAWASSEL